MKNILINTVYSLTGGVTVWFVTHSILLSTIPIPPVGDGQGHLPDPDSREWKHMLKMQTARNERLSIKYKRFSILAGIVTSTVVIPTYLLKSNQKNKV